MLMLVADISLYSLWTVLEFELLFGMSETNFVAMPKCHYISYSSAYELGPLTCHNSELTSEVMNALWTFGGVSWMACWSITRPLPTQNIIKIIPCPKWDFKPWSLCSNGPEHYMAFTLQPLWLTSFVYTTPYLNTSIPFELHSAYN